MTPKPPASAAAANPAAERRQVAMESGLVDRAKLAVDAYAAVLEHALTTYNGRVKPDEVKSIFLSVYIGSSRVA